MNDRRRRQMIEEGKRPDKIIQMADDCLENLKKEDITLGETKEIILRMACIIERSERYRPETLLRDILLSGQSQAIEQSSDMEVESEKVL